MCWTNEQTNKQTSWQTYQTNRAFKHPYIKTRKVQFIGKAGWELPSMITVLITQFTSNTSHTFEAVHGVSHVHVKYIVTGWVTIGDKRDSKIWSIHSDLSLSWPNVINAHDKHIVTSRVTISDKRDCEIQSIRPDLSLPQQSEQDALLSDNFSSKRVLVWVSVMDDVIQTRKTHSEYTQSYQVAILVPFISFHSKSFRLAYCWVHSHWKITADLIQALHSIQFACIKKSFTSAHVPISTFNGLPLSSRMACWVHTLMVKVPLLHQQNMQCLLNGGTRNTILFPLLLVGIFYKQQVRIQMRCFSWLSDVQVKCRKIWSTSYHWKPFQLPSHPLGQILLAESLRQAMNSTANGWLLLSLNQTPTSHCQIQREK